MGHRQGDVRLGLLLGRLVFGFALASGLLICLKWDTLSEAHYWDALGCYVYQGRFLAEHGLDLASYKALSFIRPPGFTGTLALIMRVVDPEIQRQALHVWTLLFGALTLVCTYHLSRSLGASRGGAILGSLACLACPLFFAQVGLVQSDLPATAVALAAWVLLLQKGKGGQVWFVGLLCLAVLVKESAYVYCPAGAVYLILTSKAAGHPAEFRWRSLWVGLPAFLPCLVLVLWQMAHRYLAGAAFSSAYSGYLGPHHLPWALVHNYLDGGRFALLPLVGIALWPAIRVWRVNPRMAVTEPTWSKTVCTALVIFSLPVMFCAPLPRYFLPSLPLLAALFGVAATSRPSRIALSLFAIGTLVLGHSGRFNTKDIAHLEASMAYHKLLANHREAARTLWALRPHSVLAGFPMSEVLRAPKEDGYLPAPLSVRPVTLADPGSLCESDYLVEGQDDTMVPALQLLSSKGALQEVAQIGMDRSARSGFLDPGFDQGLRIYRIRCGK